MSKTIEFIEKEIENIKELLETEEFIEKEIENIKELLETDGALVLRNDDNYNFWYNRLNMFQQIKAELEAWEVVKQYIVEEDNIIDRDIKVIKVKCQLYPKGESNGKYEKLKKALEVKEDDN